MMADEDPDGGVLADRAPSGLSARMARIFMSEEAVYGLILVSGMIVVSNNVVGTSLNALATVVATVLVFFAAHVYAGTLARLAASDRVDIRRSLTDALHHSTGMLIVAVVPIIVLALGVTHVLDDEIAIWTALILDAVVLGVLGWVAVSRWTTRFWPRLLSALITAGFGGVIALLKALIH